MPKKQDEKDKTQRKYVYYSIVYNFHSQSNIKNDFLKALSVLSCKHKKQIGNWLTLMLNNASQFLHEYCQRHFSFNVMFRKPTVLKPNSDWQKSHDILLFLSRKIGHGKWGFSNSLAFEMRTRMLVVFMQ